MGWFLCVYARHIVSKVDSYVCCPGRTFVSARAREASVAPSHKQRRSGEGAAPRVRLKAGVVGVVKVENPSRLMKSKRLASRSLAVFPFPGSSRRVFVCAVSLLACGLLQSVGIAQNECSHPCNGLTLCIETKVAHDGRERGISQAHEWLRHSRRPPSAMQYSRADTLKLQGMLIDGR